MRGSMGIVLHAKYGMAVQSTSLWLPSKLFATAGLFNYGRWPCIQLWPDPQWVLSVLKPECIRYPDTESLKAIVEAWLEGQTQKFYFNGINSLGQKCHKCAELWGDYVEQGLIWQQVASLQTGSSDPQISLPVGGLGHAGRQTTLL